VDHDTQVLAHADWIIELGPEAGAKGGNVIAEGSVAEICRNPVSRIGAFLGDSSAFGLRMTKEGRLGMAAAEVFAHGAVKMPTGAIHTVKPLEVAFPKGRLSVVTGVSGSGKTTMVLESLIPGLQAQIAGKRLPGHVLGLEAEGIGQVKLIDATPIGINVRSTVATYSNVHDELRKVYARSEEAKAKGFKAGDFSYNTGKLRCPTCDGTGSISLDVQFLPDVDIPCPDCHGSRYGRDAFEIHRKGGLTLPQIMEMSVDEALEACADLPLVRSRLQVLHDLGLGYLTLGEATPSLSGGEAQRLKLASEMGRGQDDSVFVFDEPTIGLHPLDVHTLMDVFRHLIGNGATVIVIEHDLDVIRAADWIVDMGPGGGKDGGRIVAVGTPAEIKSCRHSVTGRYL
jgi:excinuclease ABC subunit A